MLFGEITRKLGVKLKNECIDVIQDLISFGKLISFKFHEQEN